MKYIIRKTLDSRRNRGVDIIWKHLCWLIVDMFVKQDNGENETCRENINNCKHRESKIGQELEI